MSCVVQHLVASMDAFEGGENPVSYDLEPCKTLANASPASSAVATGAVAS